MVPSSESVRTIKCQDCGADLTDLDKTVACSDCGSTHRNVQVSVLIAAAVGTAAVVSLEMLDGDDRPWHEMWSEALRELEVIREGYANASRMDNVVLKSAINTFFISCEHLREWVKQDLELTDVAALYNNEPDLQLCTAICNTKKHRTRCSAKAVTARVKRMGRRVDGGLYAEVSYGVRGQPPQIRDSLDLADSCVSLWRQFFAKHGIAEP